MPTTIVGRHPSTDRLPTIQPEVEPAMNPMTIQPTGDMSTGASVARAGLRLRDECLDLGNEPLGVGVMSSVAGAVDHDHPSGRKPCVECGRCDVEWPAAVRPEHLEHRE